MLSLLGNIFHRLLNPHCSECIIKDEELSHDKECKSCETLNRQLELTNQNYKELLNSILHRDDEKESDEPKKEFKPIRTIGLPWRVRQQMLEQEDKIKAQIIAREKMNNPVEVIKDLKYIKKLEDKMGLAMKERESHGS